MDWDKLKIFHTVAEAGSFTHAGEALDLSQSSVSRKIGALEKSLGLSLFHRHARGLMLTEQGEVLFRTVHEMFAKLVMTEAQLTEIRDRPRGPLAITTTQAFGSIWLTPRLRDFVEIYPEIPVTLLTSDSELDLSMHEADVAIRLTKPTQPDLVRRRLMTVHTHLYASPRYLAKNGSVERPEDLRRHNLILYGEGPLSQLANLNWVPAMADGGKEKLQVVLKVNNVLGMVKAVESGIGVAPLPDYAVQETAPLLRVLPGLEGPRFDTYFTYPEALRDSKRIAVFRDFLLREVAKTRF